ncbi:MAG: hypothetical protein ACI8QS_000986 [Planctomycetota bacterium]|jgi:hypothetical protein
MDTLSSPQATDPAPARSRAGWLLVGGLALALVGFITQPSGAAATTAAPRLILPATQGSTGGGGLQNTSAAPSLGSGYGTADSNGSMIAVTGIDVTGGSLLYLIDSESKQLAVYQAQGGTASTMNLKFVAGRRIDLDLQVYGYNDESDYTYDELQREFERNGNASNPKREGEDK